MDSLKAIGVQPASVYPQGTFYPRLRRMGVTPYVFGSNEYTPSTYSSAVMDGAELRSFKTLAEALVNVGLLIEKQTQPIYINLYFDKIDALSHEYGPCAGYFSHPPGFEREKRIIMLFYPHNDPGAAGWAISFFGYKSASNTGRNLPLQS